jgi:hypothetical protein
MTDDEAAAMFRADAIAAGLPPHYDPNVIAMTLHKWLESVPATPSDLLWREVWFLRIGRDFSPGYFEEFPFDTEEWRRQIEPLTDWENYYERCADACRGVLCRQAISRRKTR